MSRMARLAQQGKRSRKTKTLGEPEVVNREDYEAMELDSRLELIRSLIPLGLMAVYEELEQEVVSLASARHSRKREEPKHYRHGTNPGTVRLAGQRVAIEVPRVRGREAELRLQSYGELHRGVDLDELLFRRALYGISCRNYERAAAEIPGAIGLSSSSVSRQFVEASAAKLREFQERDLSDLDLVVLFLDGKSFADNEMLIALGVTISGEKQFLGFVQTETENEWVVSQFSSFPYGSRSGHRLGSAGGDRWEQGHAVFYSEGIPQTYRGAALPVAQAGECGVAPAEEGAVLLAWSPAACLRSSDVRGGEARVAEDRDELVQINESAARSLDEGFEETLTLHRLGLFAQIGRSLKTTNILELVNSKAEERCGRVDHWQNSKQKQRWLTAALLDIEPHLRRLVGYRHLPALQAAIMKELKLGGAEERSKRAA